MYGDCPPRVLSARPRSLGDFQALAGDLADDLPHRPVWCCVATPKGDLEPLLPAPGEARDGVDVLAAHLALLGIVIPRRTAAAAAAAHVGSGLIAGRSDEVGAALGVPVEAWQPTTFAWSVPDA